MSVAPIVRAQRLGFVAAYYASLMSAITARSDGNVAVISSLRGKRRLLRIGASGCFVVAAV